VLSLGLALVHASCLGSGALVFRKGDLADRIYFIIHGGITLYKEDDHKRIRRYDQGGLFGEMNVRISRLYTSINDTQGLL
jgi:CRP-like cAMP-binding protein